MGQSYVAMLADRELLLGQMQMYAACDDPDIRDVARAGFGELFQEVERLSGRGRRTCRPSSRGECS